MTRTMRGIKEMPMPDRIERPADPIAAEEATIKSAARGARADRDRLALQLSREPNSIAVADDLQALEAELDSYRKQLERIAGARRALALAQTAAGQAERQTMLDKYRQVAIAASAERAKAACKVEKALADLGAALRAEAAAGSKAWGAVNAAARLLPEERRRAAATGLQGAALGNCSPTLSALNAALRGAEAEGSRLGNFIDLHGLHDPQPAISEAAAREAATLTAAISAWSLAEPEAAVDHDEFGATTEAA